MKTLWSKNVEHCRDDVRSLILQFCACRSSEIESNAITTQELTYEINDVTEYVLSRYFCSGRITEQSAEFWHARQKLTSNIHQCRKSSSLLLVQPNIIVYCRVPWIVFKLFYTFMIISKMLKTLKMVEYFQFCTSTVKPLQSEHRRDRRKSFSITGRS